MSIFAINYLYDISQHGQSLVNLKQEDLKKLKQKTKLKKEKFRQSRYQYLVHKDQQIFPVQISDQENKILQDALQNQRQSNQTGDILNNQIVQDQDRNTQIEEETFEKEQIMRNSIEGQQNVKNMRQKIYMQVIQRRYQKLKKTDKRDYFNTHYDM